MIAQIGKLAVVAATGAAAGVSGAFFAVVVDVAVRELVVVGAVVVSRVEVEVVAGVSSAARRLGRSSSYERSSGARSAEW